VRRFVEAFRRLRHEPFLEDIGLDKSAFMMIREMEHTLMFEEDDEFENLRSNKDTTISKPTTSSG
jgi:hypothetical protein